MAAQYLLFLDFDGVICDSVDECFLSSWIAYYRYYRRQEPLSVSLEVHRQFGLLRPFVRDGEDYLLLHQILDQGQSVRNQAEFDLLIAKNGKECMSLFKELFYKARNFLVSTDFAGWCGLNRLYPHIAPLLARAAAKRTVFILSTKKPEFITAILDYNGIAFNREQILYPGKKSKYAVIKELLSAWRGYQALFVDDQIDHLLKETDSTIVPCLAAWGYVKAEWLTAKIRVIQPGEVEGVWGMI